MKTILRTLFLAIGWFFLATLSAQGGAGDKWKTVRGDLSPGLSYDYMTTTPSGRLLALTDEGGLMYSDTGGTSWNYGNISVGGMRVRGGFSFLTTINGAVIAIRRELVRANQGFFTFVVQSQFYTSSDNGNSWTRTDFPIDHVQYGGIQIFGTDIRGLAEGPGGNLLAYGTVSGTNNGVILWSIGGAIFRNSGGTWSQAHFGYGPVWKIADADGRAVATAHNAILDSADGGGWNGYRMSEGMITLSGNPLSSDHLDRLRVTDVEVVGGTYVVQGATFVPFGPNADSSAVDNLYTLSSPTPFGPSRNWTAYAQSHYYGKYLKAGTSLLGIGGRGQIWKSTNGGASFGQTSTGADIPWGVASGAGSSTYVAVEDSSVAWRSTDTGSSWSKVFDVAVGPDFFLIGRFHGKVYALGGNDLWVSDDEGGSWRLFSTSYNGGTGTFIEVANGRMIARVGGGAGLQVSDDEGVNWSNRTVTDTLPVVLRGGMVRTPTGRIVAPALGRSTSNQGRFYVSDDNGETWTGKVANLEFSESPTCIAVTASGRLLVTTNTFAIFNPALYISDDDGETWTKSLVFRSTEGLDPISNDPTSKVVTIAQIITSQTGRLIALGVNDEILTSDDEGETWIVRKNLDLNWTGPFMDWELRDLVEVSGRWVVRGTYERPYPQSGIVQFLLVSDDDGATWRQIPFETKQYNSYIGSMITGTDGRLIVAGGNATVMISESDALMEAEVPEFSIRENTIGVIPIERPALSGQVVASYSAVADTARVNIDFLPSTGTLTWESGDNAPKMVEIETVDNNSQNGERLLNLQLRFEMGDGVLGEVDVPVSIEDDEGNGRTSLQFDGDDALYTSESGETAELGIALERKPAANVTVTVNGEDQTEGILSAKTFTFTPTNWNVQQFLTITGVDDNVPDGDHSYDLRFVVTSTDTSFASLPETILSVTNLGDEPYEVGGEFLGGNVPPAPRIFVKRAFKAKGSKALIKGVVTMGVVDVRVRAGKGGYKRASLRGTTFTFTVKRIKPGKTISASILATTSDSRRAVANVKISAKK